MNLPRVVHICTVHNWNDVRIFQKQCVSLAKSGYDVHFIVSKGPEGLHQGVTIHPINSHKTRFSRMTKNAYLAVRKALELNGDIYVIHSPELLPLAFFFHFSRKKVVYDVHEDYGTQIQQKYYLPRFSRKILALAVRIMEKLASRFLTLTLAERYYQNFLPGHSLLLNYPLDFNFTVSQRRDGPNCRILLFTGNVSLDRGALNHAKLLMLNPDVEVHLIGNCPSFIATQSRSAAGLGVDRLHIYAVDKYVPHDRIREYYQRNDLLAGIAICPSNPDLVNKEFTKFFEYMAAGLPILCSDFAVWQRLVVDNGVGLTVDPECPEAIAEAIHWLREHPKERQQMGERGRRLVAEKFNWASQEKILVQIYDKLAVQIGDQ